MPSNPMVVRNFVLGWESLLDGAGEDRIIPGFLLECNGQEAIETETMELIQQLVWKRTTELA